MVAVHILIFGEMAGFNIVPFIATHVKRKFFSHGAMKNEKKFAANQSSHICMKTTDIKLFGEEEKMLVSIIFFFSHNITPSKKVAMFEPHKLFIKHSRLLTTLQE